MLAMFGKVTVGIFKKGTCGNTLLIKRQIFL
jgi:hypothetical protein